jgi:hypothetical protein
MSREVSIDTSTSLESEATLKARDYGLELCMPIQCMRTILKDFRRSENRRNMAEICSFSWAFSARVTIMVAGKKLK